MAASTWADLAPWGVALIAAAGTYAATKLQARSMRESPATVAEGYGALVADLRADLDRLRAELTLCNERHKASDARIAHLEAEVGRLTGSP